LLAVEATVAFFLESTFIAVWFFGWKRLSPKMHATAIWLVAIASNISAFWILVANAWMQHPVGYVIRHGRAELASFFDVITQKFAILEYVHTLGGAYILAGFFVLGISAWHLARNNDVVFFRKSFRIAAIWTFAFSLLEIAQGHMNAEILSSTQPAKLAAMESHWVTADHVPLKLVVWPDVSSESNAIEAISVPNGLSLLANYSSSSTVKGLKDFAPQDRPPVLPVFLSFRTMVGLAFLFLGISAVAFLRRNAPESSPWLLKLLPWCIPIPYLANELGWTLAELGRQPWIVYGMMRTSDAVSRISSGQVFVSLLGFILVYSLLGFVDFFLLWRFAKLGPR
jgi:cytochrome d ubiquinol oxidase subunit I